MGGTSKVVMGAVLIMVVSLAMVLGLVSLLLAQLYCSLLLRRKSTNNLNNTTATGGADTAHSTATGGAPSLTSFYSQGVLQAPRSFLSPAVPTTGNIDLEKQDSHRDMLVFSSPSSPGPLMKPLASPKPVHEVPLHCSTSACADTVCCSSYGEEFIYICNPMYSRVDTPFETPDTSPSRLDTAASSGEDINDDDQLSSPALTPMKKLPPEACSVSLRDARSLGISGSDSNSNNDGISSSSSALSPCTSPSW